MTLHQPFYNMDQQVLHELYATWILAGAFILLCVATLLVISKILRRNKVGLIVHLQAWNLWRKHNTNNKMHKILVLLKLIFHLQNPSPTLCQAYFSVGLRKGMKKVLRNDL